MTATLSPHHGAHEQQPSGLWTRYRAQYEKLPPGAQMIGLQLWLPLVFVIAFCFCYIAAFHAPAPHQVPVAVVGSGAQTQTFAQQLQANSAGALSVRVEPDIESARAAVRSGDLAAAYAPGTTSAVLILASADNYQLSAVARTTFAAVATSAKQTLQTEDLAALPKHDAYGTTLFYLTLVWTIAGYMTAMFVGMMGGALKHRLRIGIIAASSVVLPLIATVIVRFPLGAVDHGFFELWGIGMATAFAVGMVVNGLGYFFGRFVTAFALVIFVFANVPSAGGAYPPEFLPQPFRALHQVVSGTGTLDALRSVVYGVGPGVAHGLLILACYAVAGLLLAFVGKPYYTRRMARRAARGARPSMMIAAQMSAMSLASAATADPGAHAAPDAPDEAENALTVDDIVHRRDADRREGDPAQAGENGAQRSAYAAQEVDGDATAAVTGATG